MNFIEAFAAVSGVWNGKNTLQDPMTGKPEESLSTATVTPVLGGRFVRIDYTWSYQGKPQEGSILIGFEPESGVVSGHWIDTWHMGRKGMACLGTLVESAISVTGSYAAPPGPDWGWRIEVATDPLRITHTNIEPNGEESLAVESVYTRGLFFKATGPIGDTDIAALPVKEIGPAVGFYTQCLGFSLVAMTSTTAQLKRDDVEIGLAVNGKDPEQASCWFSVTDVEALWQEFHARGLGPGPIDAMNHDGKRFRAFFARDAYSVCFCFTQPT